MILMKAVDVEKAHCGKRGVDHILKRQTLTNRWSEHSERNDDPRRLARNELKGPLETSIQGPSQICTTPVGPCED
jgi:hypothetical protein